MPALPVLPSVLAHGVGARGDLPVDIGFLAWGSGLVLVVSFAAFGVLWTTPRLAAAAERTRPLGSGPTRLVDVLAVVGSVFAFAVWDGDRRRLVPDRLLIPSCRRCRSTNPSGPWNCVTRSWPSGLSTKTSR